MTADPRFAQAVERTIATYDRVATNYAERNAQSMPFWQARMRQFVDLLHAIAEEAPLAELPAPEPPEPDGALDEFLRTVPVLDAGCGPGRDARALAAEGLPVLAVDLSAGMLDAARERTPRRLTRGAIHYALMDLRRLDLPDGCCQGIWCSASLLHLPKTVAPRAVAELARVARRGAPLALFLKQDDRGGDQGFIEYEHAPVSDAQRFFAFYSPAAAATLVREAGFTIVNVAETADPRSPDAPGWVSVLATRG